MTTRLFPRLPLPDGRVLLRQWTDKRPDQLTELATMNHPAAFFAATGGVPASARQLRNFADLVRGCATDFGFPSVTRAEAEKIRFDRSLARVLHESMEISPAEAAEPDVWTFIACCLLPDVVMWRWGIGNEERWVGQGLVRHAFGRLWWQAHALHTRTADGHDYSLLAQLGEADLNQVFERRSMGGNPSLARALVQELSALDVGGLPVSRRDIVRDVTKRVRRLLPYTAFHALEEADVRERVASLVQASVRAFRWPAE
ncbi:DUF6339 family protein [Amycolatopsis thermoflava]|uniref:DUF6339 family protein n=1 Tax=Amycolatopsis thermoflava TaxID=84480 RepID=UPI003F4A5C2A